MYALVYQHSSLDNVHHSQLPMSLIYISLYAHRTAQPSVLPRRETQNYSKKVVVSKNFDIDK